MGGLNSRLRLTRLAMSAEKRGRRIQMLCVPRMIHCGGPQVCDDIRMHSLQFFVVLISMIDLMSIKIHDLILQHDWCPPNVYKIRVFSHIARKMT